MTRVLKEIEKQKRGKWMSVKDFWLQLSANQLQVNEKGVVFGAWDAKVSPIMLSELSKRFPKAKRTVLWTSPIAQTEFTEPEIGYILQIKNYLDLGMIDLLWAGSREWCAYFDPKKCFFSPYPIDIRKKQRIVKKLSNDSHTLEIGLLGPLATRKNVLNQLTAVKMVGGTVHTNNLGSAYEAFCKSMNIRYVAHPWFADEGDYLKLVASLDVGMQISHRGAESRSYILVDFLGQDVPCLSSVEWAPPELQCQPDDIHGMVLKMRYLGGSPRGGYRTFVKKYAEQVNRHFNQTLTEQGL